MNISNKKLIRMKLEPLCTIGLYNVLYNNQDYSNTINSLISLRHLWERFPERTYRDGVWKPCDKNGKLAQGAQLYGRSSHGKKSKEL